MGAAFYSIIDTPGHLDTDDGDRSIIEREGRAQSHARLLLCSRACATLARGLRSGFGGAMARAAALAALALIAAAAQCAALGAPQPAGVARATEVYASLLQGSPRVSVGGYVSPDGFAPLKPNEARPRPRSACRVAQRGCPR